MRDLTLSPSLFAILSDLVEERTGIHYEPHDNELFSSKLVARALEAGFESPLDYYYYLRYDDADRREFDALLDGLVVGETYFFREAAPLRVLCETMIRPAIDAGKKPRIWCAAASTGEEPLTLAMILADAGLLSQVEIVASDISLRALARAKEGVYGQRSFRTTTPSEKSRWFLPTGEGAVVDRSLRDVITWRRINLLDPSAVSTLGKFDAILCRNVLIYFGEATVRNAVMGLSAALVDGGTLVVGVSESLLRFGTLLHCEEHAGSFFYRKVRS